MKFQAIALSDVGRHRRNNEDNLYFKHTWRKPEDTAAPFKSQMGGEDRRTLFAVCDGLGGAALGEQASYMAVSGLKILEDRFNNVSGQSFPKLMDHYIARTNETISQYISQNGGFQMGTTLTALLLGRNVAQVINVGDSMAYLYRDQAMHPLTQKHTHVQRLLDMKIITEEESLLHPDRHRLTQHLGMDTRDKAIEPTVSPEIRMKTGDIYLLSSDGITEMLTLEEISTLLAANKTLDEIASSILDAALEAGGKDNATLILVQIVEANELVPGLHPDAVEDPPFELKRITHQEPSSVATTMAAPGDDVAKAKGFEMKKSNEQDQIRQVRPQSGIRQTGNMQQVPNEQAPTVSTDTMVPGPKTVEEAATAKIPVQRAQSSFTLSPDDQERFKQAQMDAMNRQRQRKVLAAPIKVSTAYEDEQLRQARELQRQRSRPGFNWSGLLRNLIFFFAFIAIGYGLAWLLFNLASIRTFFGNILT